MSQKVSGEFDDPVRSQAVTPQDDYLRRRPESAPGRDGNAHTASAGQMHQRNRQSWNANQGT